MSCVSCVPPYLTLRGLIFFKSKYWVSCYSLLQPQLFTRKGNIKFSPSEFLQPLMLILLSRLFLLPRTKDLYYLIFIDFFLSPTLLFFMVCCWGEIKPDLSQKCSYLFTRLISDVWSDFSKQRLGWAGRPTETSKQVRFLVMTPPPQPGPAPEEIILHSLQEPIFHWYLIWGITSVGWY